ncbi:hypothetical protein WDV06_11715 [Streptomyces racemochromogenes]|uniref:Uncharacterized protein n=1 Tax=Streptomyces racemochromogenes TaxID=67353 RepID=A0ABW7PBZ1_9ACTN
MTQSPSATRIAGEHPGLGDVDGGGGDVSFAFSVPRAPEAAPVVGPDTRGADLVLEHARLVDELLGCAVDAPRATVAHLLTSRDFRTARLGRAIQAIRDELLRAGRSTDGSLHSTSTSSSRSGTTVLDPVTHDPAW